MMKRSHCHLSFSLNALHSQHFVGKCKWVTILVVVNPRYPSLLCWETRGTVVFRKGKSASVVLTAAMPKWSPECMFFWIFVSCVFVCVAVALKICVYSVWMMLTRINFFFMVIWCRSIALRCRAEMFCKIFCRKAAVESKMHSILWIC